MIQTGGINGHITLLGHEPPQLRNGVRPGGRYGRRTGQGGGRTPVPAVEIPAGAFAWFADPMGNTIGLWKPAAV